MVCTTSSSIDGDISCTSIQHHSYDEYEAASIKPIKAKICSICSLQCSNYQRNRNRYDKIPSNFQDEKSFEVQHKYKGMSYSEARARRRKAELKAELKAARITNGFECMREGDKDENSGDKQKTNKTEQDLIDQKNSDDKLKTKKTEHDLIHQQAGDLTNVELEVLHIGSPSRDRTTEAMEIDCDKTESLRLERITGATQLKLRKRKENVAKCKFVKHKELIEVSLKNTKYFLNKGERLTSDNEKLLLKYMTSIYHDLSLIDEFRPALEIVVSSSHLSIVCILDEKHVGVFDPLSAGKNNVGIQYGDYGYIFIAISGYYRLDDEMKRQEMLAIIAHEFAHYAIYLTYINQCRPYPYRDDEAKKAWEILLVRCKLKKYKNQIISDIFLYEEQKQINELVARYYECIVRYQVDNSKLIEFKGEFSYLETHMREQIIPDFKSEVPRLKALNFNEENCGILKKHETLGRAFKENCHQNFELKSGIFLTRDVDLYLNLIYYKYNENYNLNYVVVFTKIDFVIHYHKNEFSELFHRKNKPIIIVDCRTEEKEEEKLSQLFEIVGEMGETRFSLLLHQSRKPQVEKLVELSKFKSSDVQVTEEIFWENLEKKFVDRNIKTREISFQRIPLKFENLINFEDICQFKNLPKNNLLTGKMEIGCYRNFEVVKNSNYIKRRYLRTKSNSEEAEEEITEFEEIMNEDCQLTLIVNEPGAGKSTEMSEIYYRVQKRYPERWIVFADLKNYLHLFENVLKLRSNDKDVDKVQNCDQFAEFFSIHIMKLEGFEKEVFEYLVKNNRVVFMLDSLDEISTKHHRFIYDHFTEIIRYTKCKTFISTREHFMEKISKTTLNHQVVRLKEFDDSDIKTFVRNRCVKIAVIENEIKEIVDKILWHLNKFEIRNSLLIRMFVDIFCNGSSDFGNETKIFQKFDIIGEDIIQHSISRGGRILKDRLELNQNLEDIFIVLAIRKFCEMSQEYSIKEELKKIETSLLIPGMSWDLETIQQFSLIHLTCGSYEPQEEAKNSVEKYEFIHPIFIDIFLNRFLKTCQKLGKEKGSPDLIQKFERRFSHWVSVSSSYSDY